MKIRLREADDLALDWAVAVAMKFPDVQVHRALGVKLPEYTYYILVKRHPSAHGFDTFYPRSQEDLTRYVRDLRMTVICGERWTESGYVDEWAVTTGRETATQSYEHVQMDPTFMILKGECVLGPTWNIAVCRCLAITRLLTETLVVPKELWHVFEGMPGVES